MKGETINPINVETYTHELELKQKRKATIYFIGDIHYGSPVFREDLFTECIETIKKTNNSYVILMGDLLEVGTRNSVGDGVYTQTCNTDEQYDWIIQQFLPIKNKIIGCHTGNHEARVYKQDGFDLTKNLCRELDTPYLDSHTLHTFKIKDNYDFTILTMHGASGGRLIQSKMKSLMDFQNIYDADCYVMAHTHHCLTWDNPYYTRDRKKRRYFLLSGSFMDYIGSYAQNKGLLPAEAGYGYLTLHKDRVDFDTVKENLL